MLLLLNFILKVQCHHPETGSNLFEKNSKILKNEKTSNEFNWNIGLHKKL